MNTILISLPIFLIVFCGWFLKKIKIVKDEWIHVLNLFAYYVSLPALIIASFWDINFTNKSFLTAAAVSFITVILFSFAVFFLLSILKIRSQVKAAIFITATVGNTIYMGFPMTELGFGKNYLPETAVIGVIYLVIPILISIFVVKYWHDKTHKISKHLFELLKNPLVISSIVGILISFVALNSPIVPGFKKAVSMLGATASPIALFTLGAFLYGRFLKKNLIAVGFATLLKMIAFPILIFACSFYFLKTKDVKIFSLLGSMPVAVTTFVIAEKYDLDQTLVGNAIIISTILSFIVAPIVIYLFS